MKYFIFICFSIFLLLSLSSCYFATQGYYLLKYTYSAKPIIEVLEQKNVPDSTKNFLNNVIDIKSFIKTHVHLVNDKNYKNYKDLNQDYLVLVVQGSPKTKIEPYMWYYPFFGKMPYRGYYEKKGAIKEAKRLQKKGYETYVRKVQAFSTLGALSDPLYSFMEDYTIGDLAELISHEQTHATIWVRGKSTFNEQLATFVGRASAKEYLTQKFGINSKEYTEYRDEKKDRALLSVFLNEVKNELNKVYKNDSLSDEEKITLKTQVLSEQHKRFVTTYDKTYLLDSYKNFDIQKFNNAFFALISVYEENLDLFADAFKRCDNNLTTFIDTMATAKTRAHKKNPFVFVKNMCKS